MEVPIDTDTEPDCPIPPPAPGLAPATPLSEFSTSAPPLISNSAFPVISSA